MKIKTGSIREVHKSLLEDGYHVSEYSIRCWIKQGLIPAAYNGRKAYINFDAVVAVLTPVISAKKEEKTAMTGIRPV